MNITDKIEFTPDGVGVGADVVTGKVTLKSHSLVSVRCVVKE